MNEQNDDGLSYQSNVIQVHPVDAKQFTADFVKKQEINHISDPPDLVNVGTAAAHIDASNFISPQCKISEPNEQINSLVFVDEASI